MHLSQYRSKKSQLRGTSPQLPQPYAGTVREALSDEIQEAAHHALTAEVKLEPVFQLQTRVRGEGRQWAAGLLLFVLQQSYDQKGLFEVVAESQPTTCIRIGRVAVDRQRTLLMNIERLD